MTDTPIREGDAYMTWYRNAPIVISLDYTPAAPPNVTHLRYSPTARVFSSRPVQR